MAASPAMQQLRETDPGDCREVQPSPHTQLAASCAIECTPTAPRQMRAFASALLSHWGIKGETADDVELIVSELVTNAVVHSGSHDVELQMTITGRVLCLSIRDHGSWVRPKPPTPAGVSGRGLPLVAQLATTRGTHRTPEGTRAWAQCVLDEGVLLSGRPAC